jgi:tellurite resistance protein TerC
MLALDLGVFHKDDHVVTFKESLTWTGVWVSVAVLFGVAIYFFGEYIHGIDSMDKLVTLNKLHGHNLSLDLGVSLEENLAMYREALALEYYTGYLIEEALSIDNIFVMIMIFVSFGIDQKYYHRVLFWGIIGAIVLRFVFIFASAALIQEFSWILAVFGAILVISGIKMFFDKNDEKIDTEKHPMVRFCSKYFRLHPQGHGHDFFCRIDGKRYITPLFVVLLVIEFSDVIFAVDSIPAVFSVTQDPFIVFFSNIFAILGLRSLFFMLSNVMNMFWTLKYGLGVLLTFIGVKMLLHTFWHIEIGTGMSLLVIAGILVLSILISLIFPKKETKEVVE